MILYIAIALMRHSINRFIGMALFGSNEREAGAWMWRLTFFSNFYASICSLQYAVNERLADLFVLHYLNILLIILWWIAFLACLFMPPGYVGEEQSNSKAASAAAKATDKYLSKNGEIELGTMGQSEEQRERLLGEEGAQGIVSAQELYERGLNRTARLETSANSPIGDYEVNLCHSCHVQRPLRSKHCRFAGKCVHKFDHFW